MDITRFLSGTAVAAAVLNYFVLCSYGEKTVEADIRSAKAAILVETTTGQVLCGYNENLRLPIASVTKIMTLLLAAEKMEEGALSFEENAVCSEHAASMDGSVIWLEAGETMSVGDIVKSVVISSANDACVVLAEHIAGSEEEFVGMMNERADQLGMTGTHFSNCVGYDDKDHYSTARDISVMAAELKKYDYFDDYFLTRLDSVRTGTTRETQLLNTNKLINSYSGITGLKTGTTDGAGCCFVGTAKRGDMELAAVVLGCGSDGDRFAAAENLLDCGFNDFEKITPHPDTAELIEIPVENGIKKGVDTRYSDISAVILPKGGGSSIKYHYSRTGSVSAPVQQGQVLGFVTMTSGDEVVATAKIIAAESIEEMDIKSCLEYLFRAFFGF